MCRNVTGRDGPAESAGGGEAVERTGGDIVAGIGDKYFTGHGIDGDAVWPHNAVLRAIRDEIPGDDIARAYIDHGVGHLIPLRRVAEL